LRCDTEEDRNAWIDTLLAAKDRFPRSLTANDFGPMSDIMVSTEKLRTRLLQEGLNETVVKECESIMMNELLELDNQIKSQQQQHSILIDRLRQMEVDSYLLLCLFDEFLENGKQATGKTSLFFSLK
jgi:oxysterol-binding protein 1